MKLTKKLKEDWLAALKSGKYIQCTGSLQKNQNEFCCLGVFCEISNIKHNNEVCIGSEDSYQSYAPIEFILGNDILSELWRENDASFDKLNPNYENVIPVIEKLPTID